MVQLGTSVHNRTSNKLGISVVSIRDDIVMQGLIVNCMFQDKLKDMIRIIPENYTLGCQSLSVR